MEHGFGGTLLLGSSSNINNIATNTNNANNATAAHNSDRDSGELDTSARLTTGSGLTRSSSGTSHDSAVDLFYQDQPLDEPITAKNEYELQLAQALALSVQEATMETSSYDYEPMELAVAENPAQRQGTAIEPDSTFTFNNSSSTGEGDASNSQVSTSQEPVSQPAVPSQRQHKLYSLQELQQHKRQQQASERTLKPHQRVHIKKIRQEEKEEGEISTSAVSTYGESEDEPGPFTFNKAAVLQVPPAAHSPVLFSPHGEATSSLYPVPSADIHTSTQQSEDQQCYTAHSTQDSAVPVLDILEEGEVIDGQEVQDEQETEPQFEGSPVLVAPAKSSLVDSRTAGSTAAREKKKKPQPGVMKLVSPAELLQMSASTPDDTCTTPVPPNNNINNNTRGGSSNEPISLENTPSGSPDE